LFRQNKILHKKISCPPPHSIVIKILYKLYADSSIHNNTREFTWQFA
jgi:hypothetical protein